MTKLSMDSENIIANTSISNNTSKGITIKNNINDATNTKCIDKGYLLSTKDLCSLDLLPTLVNLGITCFKIEGRLKNPEYVATVTRIYRKYIDLAKSDKPYIVDEDDRKDLLQVFNRGGFSTGYLEQHPNQNLIYKNKPNNMGIFLGTVSNYNSNRGYVTLKLQDKICIGDTVSLEKESGSYNISELMINNKNVPFASNGDIVKIGRIKGNISVNDKVFKMSSKELNSIASEYANSENIKAKINCKIVAHKNHPVSMQIYTRNTCDVSNKDANFNNNSNTHYSDLHSNSENIYNNIDFTITSELIPVEAVNSPISKERIISQINKLGGTPFEFEKITVDLQDNLHLPSISKLNQLRRDCISKLEEILLDRIHRKYSSNLSKPDTFITPTVNSNMFDKKSIEDSNYCILDTKSIENNNCSKLDTQSQNQKELDTAKAKKITVLLNYLKLNYNYSELTDIDRIYIPLKYFFTSNFEDKIAEITSMFNTYIYFPSILKDSVVRKIMNSLEQILLKYSIKGFVVSNISHLHLLEKYINNYEFIANYTMNIYNKYTVQELTKQHISCATLSPELDKLSIENIDSNVATEAIVYGNLPVMTTNYCLLSKSNQCLEACSSNCNNDSKIYYLKDRLNMRFRIIPDSFSKTTTIYNSKKLSISADAIHVDFIRFDFIDENIEEINTIIHMYKNNNVLEGKDFTNGNFNRKV